MSNEKFTSAEWTAHLGIMEPTFVHIGKEEDYEDGETPVICELHHGIKKKHQDSVGFDFDCSEMRANAHLIAAAPVLYDVLNSLLNEEVYHLDQQTRENIAYELKKARGEQ